MTMTMTNSQFGLEDMEALLWEPSSPMADPVGSLLFHPDQEDQHKGGGASSEGAMSPESPLSSSSLSSISSPPSFYSPPQSPPADLLDRDKAGMESDPLYPWLGFPGLLRTAQTVSDDGKGDAFGEMDWMAEKVDLSDFDLDSLIGSCSPTAESSDSPEDLLASLDCSMELDSFPLPALSALSSASLPPPTVSTDPCVVPTVEPESLVYGREVSSPPPCVPEPQQELEIKSEPASPDPSSPVIDSPPSPADTLDLGSEVDVSGSEVELSASEVKPVLASVVPQVPRLVLSLPTRIVLVLAPKDQVGITTATVTTTTTSTTSEVAQPSAPSSPPPRSSRSRPYPEPKCKASPPSPGVSVKMKSPLGTGGEERPTTKVQKTKKIKKMEQNKTAATRYRQKKRAEQEALTTEHAILERKNMELTEKAESMAREIEYLKELMEEVRLARMKKGLSGDP